MVGSSFSVRVGNIGVPFLQVRAACHPAAVLVTVFIFDASRVGTVVDPHPEIESGAVGNDERSLPLEVRDSDGKRERDDPHENQTGIPQPAPAPRGEEDRYQEHGQERPEEALQEKRETQYEPEEDEPRSAPDAGYDDPDREQE